MSFESFKTEKLRELILKNVNLLRGYMVLSPAMFIYNPIWRPFWGVHNFGFGVK